LDHNDIIYSPFAFAVRYALEQSASGSRRLPLSPPGLSPNRKRKGKKERKTERERLREEKERKRKR